MRISDIATTIKVLAEKDLFVINQGLKFKKRTMNITEDQRMKERERTINFTLKDKQ